jgi:hypothetical protein
VHSVQLFIYLRKKSFFFNLHDGEIFNPVRFSDIFHQTSVLSGVGSSSIKIIVRGRAHWDLYSRKSEHTHYIWTEEMRKKRMHRGFGKRNEYERRDDMRSKTISSGRKEGITSMEEKGETKEKEREIKVPVTIIKTHFDFGIIFRWKN